MPLPVWDRRKNHVSLPVSASAKNHVPLPLWDRPRSAPKLRLEVGVRPFEANRPQNKGVCPIAVNPIAQRDHPEVVFWPSVFLEAWGTKAKKPHMFQKCFCWPCRPRRQGQQTTIVLKMCGFLALGPQASKNHLAKQPLRQHPTLLDGFRSGLRPFRPPKSTISGPETGRI